MQSLTAFNLQQWIDAHRDQLKPPVCNQQVFEDNDFIVMVVGGPNRRTDFHWDPGEELFYQIEGDMLLRTVQEDRIVDVPIREGEMFLLPAEVPHSPQRFPDTVGLVIERRRRPEEKDGFMWFCEKCNHKLHETYFVLHNIEKDFLPRFKEFYTNEQLRTCANCGHVMEADARFI